MLRLRACAKSITGIQHDNPYVMNEIRAKVSCAAATYTDTQMALRWYGHIFRIAVPFWGNAPVTSGFPHKGPAIHSFDISFFNPEQAV